jgi:hypothetical protein
MKPGVSYDEACQNLSKKMLGARDPAVSDFFDGITGGSAWKLQAFQFLLARLKSL